MITLNQTDQDWLDDLCAKNLYFDAHLTGDGRYVCLHRFIFTIGIIEGQVGDDWSYDRRWCYEPALARLALEEWKAREFKDKPIGWKREL